MNGLPKHIAIIMDGNGRWAKKRGLPRIKGHQEGIKTVRAMVEGCLERGIPYLTLYAFSMENWKRPRTEISFLMNLLKKFLIKERSKMLQERIRLVPVGRIDGLPKGVREEISKTRRLSRSNDRLVVCLALNYGGRAEIVDAAKRIARKVSLGKINIQNIDEAVFEHHLYAPDVPPPDLLIRTAGEMRISNFLLWQISYAEIYFTPVLWPDFKKKDLDRAILAYSKRVRRFGGLKEGQ